MPFFSRPHAPKWGMLFILLSSFALRLIGVVQLSPPGVAHDEVAHWLLARTILAGNHAVYFTEAYGHEAGYHYVEALFLYLLGDHLLALRLPAIFFGVMGVAVTYALAKRLFGYDVALWAAACTAVLFWPVFYGRLALRAISLPVVAGLSALFWWAEQRPSPQPFRSTAVTLPTIPYALLAGLFAGLSLYTYLASRALPLIYAAYIFYLCLWHWPLVKKRWPSLVAFTAVAVLVAWPLFHYLQHNPGAEFRVDEVSAPLTALRQGDWWPVWQNGWRLLGMFGWVPDPLWREGVPTVAVFEPIGAICFYAGLFISLWRWRDGRYAFILLWLLLSLTPSLVTINAPSHIRSLNALLVMSIFPAIFIHNLIELSTDSNKLSPKWGKLGLTSILFTFFLLYGVRTLFLQFHAWPNGGDVPFVWQRAFTETAVAIDQEYLANAPHGPAIAGWSPDTMDSPTLALLRQKPAPLLSHFNPQEGSLVLPQSQHLIRPSALPLDPYWQAQLAEWASSQTIGQTIHYRWQTAVPFTSQIATSHTFADELQLLGYSLVCYPASNNCTPTDLITVWRVTAVPNHARRLFIHFLDETGQQVGDAYAFDSADPQQLWFPHWQEGDWLLLRTPLMAGSQQIRLGWFDPYSCAPGPCQNLATEAGAPYVTLPLFP